jgi:hypothetical protein
VAEAVVQNLLLSVVVGVQNLLLVVVQNLLLVAEVPLMQNF